MLQTFSILFSQSTIISQTCLFQLQVFWFYCPCHCSRSLTPAEVRVRQGFERMIESFLRVDAHLNNGRAASIWPGVLRRCYPVMAAMDLTQCLLSLMMRGHRNQACANLHDFAEIFAGHGNMTKEFLRRGHGGCAFDCRFTPEHNVLDVKGMRLMLDCVTSIKKKGMLWIATQCSSFVILCRAQSKRSPSNNFLGDLSRWWVEVGNALMEASSLLFFLAFSLDIYAILENPFSSCIAQCPSLYGCFAYLQPWRFVVYMGNFYGRSCKPLHLWTTLAELAALQGPRPDVRDDALVTRHGPDSKQFTGNKELLADSEIYTPAFGRAVVQIFEHVWNI